MQGYRPCLAVAGALAEQRKLAAQVWLSCTSTVCFRGMLCNLHAAFTQCISAAGCLLLVLWCCRARVVQLQVLCLQQQSAATRPTEGAEHQLVGPTQQHRRPSQHTRQQQQEGNLQQSTGECPPSQQVSAAPVCHRSTARSACLCSVALVLAGRSWFGACAPLCLVGLIAMLLSWCNVARSPEGLGFVVPCRWQWWAAAAAGAASKWDAAAEQQRQQHRQHSTAAATAAAGVHASE